MLYPIEKNQVNYLYFEIPAILLLLILINYFILLDKVMHNESLSDRNR